MKISKKIILLFVILLSFCFLMSVKAVEAPKIEEIDSTSKGVSIKISHSKKMNAIKIYQKGDNGKWTKFFEDDKVNATSKSYFITKYRLSTNDKTTLKVVSVLEDNSEVSSEVEVAKIPEAPEPIDNAPENNENSGSNEITSVSIVPTSATLEVDSTKKLSASVQPSTSETTYTWKSSDESIAKVNSTGTVTAVKEGNAVITVTTKNGKKASCKINVISKTVRKKITLDKTSVTLYSNGTNTATLKATVTPTTSGLVLTWSTNNKKVATVDRYGKITAHANGTATITVKTDNADPVTCKVTVKSVTKTLNGHKVTYKAGDDRVYFLDTQDYSTVKNNWPASDAIIIESNGKYAMIDTSTSSKSTRVIKYLKDIGVKELEWILITHAHGDHAGGLSNILKSVKVKKIYAKDITSGSSSFKSQYKSRIKNPAKNSNVKIYDVKNSANQKVQLGDFSFQFYNTSDRLKTRDSSNGENINSVTALAKINGKKIYFAADILNDPAISCNAETAAAKTVGKVDFYKVAHHSYSPNNSVSAMKLLNPQYGVVTNKKGRSGTSNARARVLDNSRITDKTLYYCASGTVILNIASNGTFGINKLGEDK